jgi:hypothetical protein
MSRNGKIARLPHNIREDLYLRLDNNAEGQSRSALAKFDHMPSNSQTASHPVKPRQTINPEVESSQTQNPIPHGFSVAIGLASDKFRVRIQNRL